MKLGERLVYILVYPGLRNGKFVHQTSQVLLTLAFFQRKPGSLLNFNNINWQLAKLCWNNCVSLFMSEYITFMMFVKILLKSTKLKILMLHKPIGFWRFRHYVIISGHDIIFNKTTRYFSCVVNIIRLVKFTDHTS